MKIGDILQKPCDPKTYTAYARWCNQNNATLADMCDYYEVVSINSDPDKTSLEKELIEKQSWLREHDYIGTKIATGRATISDYSSEIKTMNEYAQRIDEIRAILRGIL